MSWRIHFSSGRSGVIPGAGTSLYDEATRHAGGAGSGAPGSLRAGVEYAVPVSNVRDVRDHLEGLRQRGVSVAFMDFHVHGAPGSIAIGHEEIVNWRRSFGGRGIESIFAQNAQIEFHDCNVAAGGDGEAFLADCAWTLLRRNGGTAGGSDAYAFALPGGRVPANPGNWVIAEISAGGHVHVRNARHLIPSQLRARYRDLRQRYVQLRVRTRMPESPNDPMSRARSSLDEAREHLAGTPTYRSLATANRHLGSVARFLNER